VIFAVLKFQFASNTSVLNLLFLKFIFAVLYGKFDEKNFIRSQVCCKTKFNMATIYRLSSQNINLDNIIYTVSHKNTPKLFW